MIFFETFLKRGFQYCYQHHREEFDWFLKTDDDTFMVVENLKKLLSPFDSNESVHFGHHFKYLGGYFSGGAGYVLSRKIPKSLLVLDTIFRMNLSYHTFVLGKH